MNLPFELQVQIISYLSLRTSLQVSRRVRELIVKFAEDRDYYEDYQKYNNLLFNKDKITSNVIHYIVSNHGTCKDRKLFQKIDKLRWVDEYLRTLKEVPTYNNVWLMHESWTNGEIIINFYHETLPIPREYFLIQTDPQKILYIVGNVIISDDIYLKNYITKLVIKNTNLVEFTLDTTKFKNLETIEFVGNKLLKTINVGSVNVEFGKDENITEFNIDTYVNNPYPHGELRKLLFSKYWFDHDHIRLINKCQYPFTDLNRIKHLRGIYVFTINKVPMLVEITDKIRWVFIRDGEGDKNIKESKNIDDFTNLLVGRNWFYVKIGDV